MIGTEINYDTLKTCLHKGISFSAYTFPNESKFHFIAQKNQIHTIDKLHDNYQGFIFHPYQVSSKYPVILIKNDFLLSEGNECHTFNIFLNKKPYCLLPHIQNYPELDQKEYFELFDKFKAKLAAGDCNKLVLSRIKNIKVNQSFDVVEMFKRLNQQHPKSFNHLSYTPQSGVWLGASPELLFTVEAENAKTVALAGTQPKTKPNASPQGWNEKEIKEQKFVVDYIRNILNQHFPNKPIKTITESMEAGKMFHLKTVFTFPSLWIKNLSSLLYDLHPTPAVCGSPKDKAKLFIMKNEPHDRAYYAGYLGPLNLNKQTHLFVNLRCLTINGNTLSLFLGGGITRDSIAQNEWKETELKSTTLESLL